MTSFALALVLLSALCHASWNLLLKRSGNQEIFAWSLQLAAGLTLIPLGGVLFLAYPISPPGHWLLLATIATHLSYFLLLGKAYSRSDLSLVYPVSRGMGPMLVPLVAVPLFGESVTPTAASGISLIVAGIFVVSWSGRFRQIIARPSILFRDAGLGYAVLTGLAITIYTLVDKQGVEHVQPFLYMYLLTIGSAIGSVPYILSRFGIAEVKRECTTNAWSILAAGLLAFLAYGLVLTAFSLSQVSYVAPAREVGIVVGVLLGVIVLEEPFGRGRVLGSFSIVLGLMLITLSP